MQLIFQPFMEVFTEEQNIHKEKGQGILIPVLFNTMESSEIGREA